MKKVIVSLLVLSLAFGLISCGRNIGSNDDSKSKYTTTTDPSSTSSIDTSEITEFSTICDDDDPVSTETESTETSEVTTLEVLEPIEDPGRIIDFEFLSPGFDATALIINENGHIELALKVDSSKHSVSELEGYDWVIDITNPKFRKRLDLSEHFRIVNTTEFENIKVYFDLEAAGFVPNKNEKYDIKIYALEDDTCVYTKLLSLRARIGVDTGLACPCAPELEWTYLNDVPYHIITDEPHNGKIALVLIVHADGEYIKFDAIPSLTNMIYQLDMFDFFLTIDDQKHEVNEISTWRASESSFGISLGVEAFGFVPTEAGQENLIYLEVFIKDTDQLIFESSPIQVISNLPN